MNYLTHEICRFEYHKSIVPSGHICKMETGLNVSQLRYVFKGKCTATFSVKAKTGVKSTVVFEQDDIIFIPKNLPYELIWSGINEAEFSVIEFDSAILGETCQSINKIQDTGLKEQFLLLDSASNKSDALRQLSVLYSILSKVSANINNRIDEQYSGILVAQEYIHNHYTEDFDVLTLAELCHLSPSRFYCLFKEKTGLTPINYKNRLRVKQASFLLKDNFSIEDICEKLNFCSAAYFRRVFKKETGINPSKYRK